MLIDNNNTSNDAKYNILYNRLATISHVERNACITKTGTNVINLQWIQNSS